MENAGVKYNFVAKPWQYVGPNRWTFISVPNTFAKEIRANFKREEEGWGRLKITAKIGNTTWKTAIWFDTKMETYLLPLKALVRTTEKIEIDKNLSVSIWV